MWNIWRIGFLLGLAVLTGCGSSSAPPTAGPYLNLTGNWQLIATTNLGAGVLPTPISDFMGALQSNGGSVTGTFHAIDPELSPCVPLTQDLPVTGTLDSSGNLTLSIQLAGGTATIKAALSANLQTYAAGSWTITGGACAMASTPIDVLQVPPLTGTYTGTFSEYGNTSVTANVTAVLTQSTTPNADGQFPLTGTITTTGVCPGTRTLGPEVVSGQFIQNGNTITMPAAQLIGVAALPPLPSINAAAISIADLSCSAGTLDGSLTKQ